jgi:hypothetical protein
VRPASHLSINRFEGRRPHAHHRFVVASRRLSELLKSRHFSKRMQYRRFHSSSYSRPRTMPR